MPQGAKALVDIFETNFPRIFSDSALAVLHCSWLPMGVFVFTPCPSGRRGIVVACVSPSARLSTHPPIRPSVHELYLPRMIPRHRFEMESPNWSVRKLFLRLITCHIFQMESPNLQQTCTMGYWCWKWRSLTLTFKVVFAILTQNSRKLLLSAQ